jgi:F-type H+-transporting ATPase subunit beta
VVVLDRKIAQQKIYPAMDALASSSSLDKNILGVDHYTILRDALKILERYRSLQNIIAILGEGELSEQEKITVSRAKKLIKFFSQPFFTAEQFTNVKGAYVEREQTVKGAQAILKGQYDDYSDDPFYMVGPIEEAEKNLKKS